MAAVFVDTAYHIAIVDPRDSLHDTAMSVGTRLSRRAGTTFVTTDTVLVEFLTYLSRLGQAIRSAAAEYVEMLQQLKGVTIVPQSAELFAAGLDLYRNRPDKSYSMTDCMSMIVCRRHAITDVLTYDKDFVQEGFRALLRTA